MKTKRKNRGVLLTGASGKGRGGPILDVLDYLARMELQSASNAALVCIEESPRFQRARDELAKGKGT